MTMVLVKTGIWFYDGDHLSSIEIFKDNIWTPPDEPPEPSPPRDADGYYYFAKISVTGGSEARSICYGSAESVMKAEAKRVLSPITWFD